MVKFDQCGLLCHYSLPCCPHTSSIGVAALGFPWYRSSHPLEKVLNCRYDLIIGPILLPRQVFFSCWGLENSQMVPNQENTDRWSTSSTPQSRTRAIATTDLCAGALSWWNRMSASSVYPGRFEMSLRKVLLWAHFQAKSEGHLIISLDRESHFFLTRRHKWT